MPPRRLTGTASSSVTRPSRKKRRRKVEALTAERVAGELQQQKEAAREFKRQQDETISDVSDVMFGFLSNLGEGADSMQDIWRDTLDAIKAHFLRTLTDMAAEALVKQILIRVGVTRGTGGGGRPERPPEALWWEPDGHDVGAGSRRHGRG